MQVVLYKKDLDVEFLNKLNRLTEHLVEIKDKELIWEEREVVKDGWFRTKIKKQTRQIPKYIRYIEVFPYYSGGYSVWRTDVFKSLANFCVLPLDKQLILTEHEWISLQNDVRWYDKYLAEGV